MTTELSEQMFELRISEVQLHLLASIPHARHLSQQGKLSNEVVGELEVMARRVKEIREGMVGE